MIEAGFGNGLQLEYNCFFWAFQVEVNESSYVRIAYFELVDYISILREFSGYLIHLLEERSELAQLGYQCQVVNQVTLVFGLNCGFDHREVYQVV